MAKAGHWSDSGKARDREGSALAHVSQKTYEVR